MSIAQQISKLVSLNVKWLLDDDELAFAIRELRGAASAHEEKKVAPAVQKPATKAAEKKAPKPKAKSRPKLETSTERRARLKAAREERLRADEASALGSLSERDMEALTRALNNHYYAEYEDKYFEELVDYVEQKGTDVFVNTGYWHAVLMFTLRTTDERPGITRSRPGRRGRGVCEADLPIPSCSESNLYIAVRWGWPHWFFNRMSAGGHVEILKFEQCTAHELGAWDISNVKLRSRGTIQPSIAAPGGKFVCGGNKIARPELS